MKLRDKQKAEVKSALVRAGEESIPRSRHPLL